MKTLLDRYDTDLEFAHHVWQSVHDEMVKQGAQCGGTHMMGYGTCQYLARAALSASAVLPADQPVASTLWEALDRVEAIYIEHARPPFDHDWCRLCKGRTYKGKPDIDHDERCAIGIFLTALGGSSINQKVTP